MKNRDENLSALPYKSDILPAYKPFHFFLFPPSRSGNPACCIVA
jgi:hypothetical protein